MLPGAGESKVHNCLRANLDKLSDACRKEEISLSVLQASNTELMPNIANTCKVSVILMSAHSNPEALRGAFMECCRAYQWEGWGCRVISLLLDCVICCQAAHGGASCHPFCFTAERVRS